MNALLLVVNGTLMAGLYTAAKIGGQAGVSPLSMLAWQLLFAAVALAGVAAAAGRWPPLTLRTLRYAALAGLLGISAPNLVTFHALAHVPAGLVGVIGALSPVFTYGLALVFGLERPRALRAVGIALGGAGVLATLLPRSALPDTQALPWALLALAGPLLLAGGNLFRTLAWPPGLQPLSAASLMLALQAAVAVPVALAQGQWQWQVPAWSTAPADLAMWSAGMLMTAFYLSAFELQKRAGPVVVGQLGYVITVASLLLGSVFFGERYGLATAAAVGLVFAGVALVHHGAPRPAAGGAR